MAKVPWKVAFFVWTATHGKILTIDILCERYLLIVDWCCRCKSSRKSIDHLLLHCSMAIDIWSRVLTLFGLTWVMLKLEFELAECWQGYIQHHRPAKL